MHLSLSLSLSCPASTPSLTAPPRRFSGLFARHGSPCPAPCSKLPRHTYKDVRRPHKVTQDRSLAYTLTIGRQAHCEWASRAPGGVAVSHSAASFSRASVFRAPGGVAEIKSASFLPRALVSRAPGGVARAGAGTTGSLRASSLPHSPVRRVCSSVAATSLIVVSAFEEAPVRAPTRAGSDIERRGFDPRSRRSSISRASFLQRALVCRGRGGVA
jgi:hypothetical protein